MKRLFSFLAPLATIASGILGANAHAIPATPVTEQDVVSRSGKEIPTDEQGVLRIQSNGDAYEFILKRGEAGELIAGHRSHSSHGSHGSHGSHSSHRSSNY